MPFSFSSAFSLLLCFSFSLIGAPGIQAQSFSQVQKTVASDRGPDDNYGYAVAVSGDYAIIGAPEEDLDENGIDSLFAAGAAYIVERDSAGNWTEVQKIVASDRENSDRFGRAVAISGDYLIVASAGQDYDAAGGNYIAQAGAAYIFERNGAGVWQEVAKMVASDRALDNADYGTSVGISGDYAIVGAAGPNCNGLIQKVYMIERNESGIWQEVQIITDPNSALYDYFGGAVAISGNYAVAAARAQDYDAGGSNYLGDAGAVYLIERDGAGTWSIVQKLDANDREEYDNFGSSVGMDGDRLIVGAVAQDLDAAGGNALAEAGAVYLFERISGTWTFANKVVAGDRDAGDGYGVSVSLSGDYAVVGASYEDQNVSGSSTLNNAGSAYILQRNGSGQWSEIQKIVASDRYINDFYGGSVSISGNRIISGAKQEDHDVSGGNMMFSSGSAYIYEGPPLVAVEPGITSSSLRAYPNPAHDFIRLDAGGEDILRVWICTSDGRQIAAQASQEGLLDVSHLASGMYMLRIETRSGLSVIRMVKS